MTGAFRAASRPIPDAPRGERTLALDRHVHLVLDRAEQVESLHPAPSEIEQREAACGDCLRAAGLEQRLGERTDLPRHHAEQVTLERQLERERRAERGSNDPGCRP